MQNPKKYDLARLLEEIEEDMNYQSEDLSQEKNIPQAAITELMMASLKNRYPSHGE